MVLGKEAPVRDVVEACGSDAGGAVLDEPLHQVDASDVVAVVHDVHAVGAALGEVLLRHFADGVCGEDDVVVAQHGIGAEHREVGTGHDAERQALLLVLDGETLRLLLSERDEVRHDRRVVNE